MSIDTEQESLRRTFGKYSVESIFIRLNRLCSGVDKDVLPKNLSILNRLNGASGSIYWLASETARFAIQYSIVPQYESPIQLPSGDLTDEQFDRILIEVFNSFIRLGEFDSTSDTTAEAADIINNFLNNVTAQWLTQQDIRYRTGQALLMYEDSAREYYKENNLDYTHYQAEVTKILGCPLEVFILLLGQFYGRSMNTDPRSHTPTLVPSEDTRFYDSHFFLKGGKDVDILTPAATAALDVVSASCADAQKWVTDQISDKDANPFSMPNPLLRFPYIKVFSDSPDKVLAPVPRFLLDWLYQPMMQHLRDEGSIELKRCLPFIFEKYVGKVLQLSTKSNVRWLSEATLKDGYGQNQPVNDWAAKIDSAVVLVEAKRSFVPWRYKYQGTCEEWEKQIKYWKKGVSQATKFWNNIANNKVPAIHVSKSDYPLAIIVTHGDAGVRQGFLGTISEIQKQVLQEDKIKPVPFALMSIQELEQLSTTWYAKNDDAWLVDNLKKLCSPNECHTVKYEVPSGGGPLVEELINLVEETTQRILGTGKV